MIGYCDTSAVVPLIIEEPSSDLCKRFWEDSDVVVTSRLCYVEAAAALSQAERANRLTATQLRKALKSLDAIWDEMEIIEVDDMLVKSAATIARKHALRGYDAIHCASAHIIDDEELVAASGDKRLLEAWHQLSIATYDVNASS